MYLEKVWEEFYSKKRIVLDGYQQEVKWEIIKYTWNVRRRKV